MENITSSGELKEAIYLLEAQQSDHAMQIREQLFIISESLKPANLIANTLNEMKSSPYLANNLIDAALGLTVGYISRKAIVKESDGIIRKLFGAVLQFGVTNLVAQHPDNIKAFGKFIFQNIFRKTETNYSKP